MLTPTANIQFAVDIWAAEIVLRLRDEGTPVRLICASPYQGFEKSWSAAWQERYSRMLFTAGTVLADLQDLEDIRIYPIADGAEYEIQGDAVEITKAKKHGQFTVLVTGHN